MEVVDKKEANEKSKPTYNQLKEYVDNLYQQNMQLVQKYNQLNTVMNKLPFLFEVVNNSDKFDADFVKQCTEEIVFILSPAQDKED